MIKKYIAEFLIICLCAGAFVNSGCIPSDVQTVYAAADDEWTLSSINEEKKTATLSSYNGTATEVVIPGTYGGYKITSLSNTLFSSVKTTLTSVTFPNTISTVFALEGAVSLTHVTIPEGVTNIGRRAFSGCTSLTEITLPESINGIGEKAFYGCSALKRIVIPKSVKSIDATAFALCTSLTEIVVDEENPNYCSKDGFIFSKDGTELIYYPAGKPYSGIPDTITTLGEYVFYERKDLTSVTIPDSVTEIKSSAFDGCTELTDITFSKQLVRIGNAAFRNCKNLKSIDMPDTVTKMGLQVFDGCSNLTDVKLSENLLELPMISFRHCSGLTEITLPKNLQKIGTSAFESCKKLTHVIMPDSVTQIDNSAFGLCSALGGIRLPKNLKKADASMFAYSDIYNVIIPEGTEWLGNYLFADCSNLKYVIIPQSVTYISSGFWSLMRKGSYCCYAGTVAEQFAIDNNIPYLLIGKDIYVSGDFIYTLDDNGAVKTFEYAGGDPHMVIPSELDGKRITEISEYEYFKENNWVSGITLPEGITSIGYAFVNYTNLSEIIIPESVTEIPEAAFEGSENITIKSTADAYAHTYATENNISWEEIPAAGEEPKPEPEPEKHIHSYTAAVTKYPSCVEAGEITITCSTCDDSHTETIPKLEHQIVVDAAIAPTDTTDGKTEGSHCALCGIIIKAQEVVPATGKEPDTKPEPEPEKHTHSYMAAVTKYPSCVEAGEITITCSTCDDSHTETIPKLEHQIVVDAAIEPTGTTDGKTEGSHCALCGTIIKAQEVVPAAGKEPVTEEHIHSYRKIIQKATPDTDGKIQEICSGCSDTKVTAVIARPQTITLNNVAFTYNGKKKTPSVIIKDGNGSRLTAGTDYTVNYQKTSINPGIYDVRIDFTGNYSGAVTKTYTINPKDTRLKKIQAKSKGFKVVWQKRTSQVDGYQIQYCTDGNFTNKKTKSVLIKNKTASSKQIKGLKKKQKYYVRIRTYKTVSVNGENEELYSDWSNTKVVRTKK